MNEIINFYFEHSLKEVVAEAIKVLYHSDLGTDSIVLQETKKDFEGDITLVVFPWLRFSNKSPENTAKEVGEFIKASSFPLKEYNVVKGFLNLTLNDSFWKIFLSKICSDNSMLFSPASISQGKSPSFLMVEYSSPNTNKPLHLGHIRNNLLGFSISQILKAGGNKVVMVNLVNDRGIHICKSMLAWEKFGNTETPQSSGIKGDHLVGKYYVMFDKKFREQVDQLVKQGISKEVAEKSVPLQKEIEEMLRKWEASDGPTIDLWKKMNGWVYEGFDITYKKLGVSFDKIYYESETYLLGKKIVEDGIADKTFFKNDDGSIRVDLADEGLEQKVLLRSHHRF